MPEAYRPSIFEKSGRPPIPIDWEVVNGLLEADCSGFQIASMLDIDCDTLYNRVHREFGISFTEYKDKYKEKGNSKLLNAQYEKALEKDNTMLIWLGKQRLKQKEKVTDEDEKALANRIVDSFENYLRDKGIKPPQPAENPIATE